MDDKLSDTRMTSCVRAQRFSMLFFHQEVEYALYEKKHGTEIAF